MKGGKVNTIRKIRINKSFEHLKHSKDSIMPLQLQSISLNFDEQTKPNVVLPSFDFSKLPDLAIERIKQNTYSLKSNGVSFQNTLITDDAILSSAQFILWNFNNQMNNYFEKFIIDTKLHSNIVVKLWDFDKLLPSDKIFISIIENFKIKLLHTLFNFIISHKNKFINIQIIMNKLDTLCKNLIELWIKTNTNENISQIKNNLYMITNIKNYGKYKHMTNFYDVSKMKIDDLTEVLNFSDNIIKNYKEKEPVIIASSDATNAPFVITIILYHLHKLQKDSKTIDQLLLMLNKKTYVEYNKNTSELINKFNCYLRMTS